MDSVLLQLWAVLSLLVHLAACSPILSLEHSSLEEDVPLFDEILSEQDGVDFNTLLQNMKNEFLKTLNLSDIPLHESAKVDPPEYMLELYNRFATDRTSMPSANIIRSFKNEGKSCSSPGEWIERSVLRASGNCPEQVRSMKREKAFGEMALEISSCGRAAQTPALVGHSLSLALETAGFWGRCILTLGRHQVYSVHQFLYPHNDYKHHL